MFSFLLLTGLGLHKREAQEGPSVPGWCEYFVSCKLFYFIIVFFDYCFHYLMEGLPGEKQPIPIPGYDCYTLNVWFLSIFFYFPGH